MGGVGENNGRTAAKEHTSYRYAHNTMVDTEILT